MSNVCFVQEAAVMSAGDHDLHEELKMLRDKLASSIVLLFSRTELEGSLGELIHLRILNEIPGFR